jgi:hypothetical protein
MKRKITITGLLLAGIGALALAQQVTSLQMGEMLPPLKPKYIAGPMAGSDACFVSSTGARPQVQLWTSQYEATETAEAAKWLQAATEQHKEKGLQVLVVVLTTADTQATTEEAIRKLSENSATPNVNMAVLSQEDPAVTAYKLQISPEMRNVVYVAKEAKITGVLRNLKADADGRAALSAAIDAAIQ